MYVVTFIRNLHHYDKDVLGIFFPEASCRQELDLVLCCSSFTVAELSFPLTDNVL